MKSFPFIWPYKKTFFSIFNGHFYFSKASLIIFVVFGSVLVFETCPSPPTPSQCTHRESLTQLAAHTLQTIFQTIQSHKFFSRHILRSHLYDDYILAHFDGRRYQSLASQSQEQVWYSKASSYFLSSFCSSHPNPLNVLVL